MKWMKRLRLVNWHYFQDEILEFGKQTLISGRNSAGKSTIIDALQVLFIANQRQIRFNPAAHEEAKRSLINYLRGKIGSDEKSFVRERDFTSYILGEFYDEKARRSFVIGTVMDVYSDDKIDDEFFIIPDLELAELEIQKEKGKYRNKEDFHSYALRLRPKTQFFRGKQDYQKAFLNRMGQLEQRFYRTFLRALSFKPIQDIREFVYQYILDERELQLNIMKENFELHERYQRELKDLEERKNVLERIARQHEQAIKYRDIAATQEYVIRGLKHLELMESREDLERGIESQEKELRDDKERAALTEEQYQEAQERALEYYRQWSTHELKKEKESLEARIKDIEQVIADKKSQLRILVDKVKGEIRLLESLATAFAEDAEVWQQEDREKLESVLDALRTALDLASRQNPESGPETQETLAEEIGQSGLFLAGLQMRFLQTQTRLEDKIREQEAEQDRLNQEIRGLEQKKRPYSPEVLRLKGLLEERLAGRSPVWIFCEEMEVMDEAEAWRNAIEGYLHTQRFDLLVKPQVFAEALHIYEQEKWTHRLQGVGLVDTEKEERYLDQRESGSLATLVQTDNPVIQARIDHLLGRVMQAADEQDLRRHHTAVTRTCMSYTNLVARQIQRERYEIPYIGSQAIVRQLEIKRLELETVQDTLRQLKEKLAILKQWVGSLADRKTLYEGLAQGLDLPKVLEQQEYELLEVQIKLEGLDLSEVDRLKREYEEWHRREGHLVETMKELSGKITKLDMELGQKKTQHYLLTGREKEAQAVWDSWKTEYSPELWEKAAERWQEAQRQTQPAATKLANWEGSKKGNITLQFKEFGRLRDLRQDYNIRYTYNGNLDAEDNTSYQKLLDEVAGVNIPDYQAKLAQALKQSEEEFKSDFVAKLREAIEMARHEFSQLNQALKNFPFHQDKYHFEVRPSSHYKRFYDVIMDPDIVNRGSLFDSLADEKADTLHELFERLVRGEAGDQEEFTDYRRYLDFDIAVTTESGRYYFSQVLKEKSGGETQTPFYIAVLASFYYLYNSGKTLRLVVFDEAFNKMDEERIQTSLRLIKKMGLQLIAAVPDEKMQHMAPEVSTTLIVHRDGHHCFIDMISQEEVLDSMSGDEEATPDTRDKEAEQDRAGDSGDEDAERNAAGKTGAKTDTETDTDTDTGTETGTSTNEEVNADTNEKKGKDIQTSLF
jgi:DNA repair exonuclease SbcCD ATPase subunit